jgi:hypothetical protein
MLATATFAGLRLGELGASFGTTSTAQLDRDMVRRDPKTQRAKRDVVLMPTLAHAEGASHGIPVLKP